VEDPSQLARAAKELMLAREREADHGKAMMQMQRDLAASDRCDAARVPRRGVASRYHWHSPVPVTAAADAIVS
jgi:hypothetical protein